MSPYESTTQYSEDYLNNLISYLNPPLPSSASSSTVSSPLMDEREAFLSNPQKLLLNDSPLIIRHHVLNLLLCSELINQLPLPRHLVACLLQEEVLPKAPSGPGSRVAKRVYHCLWCAEKFGRLVHAEDHIAAHVESRPLACTVENW